MYVSYEHLQHFQIITFVSSLVLLLLKLISGSRKIIGCAKQNHYHVIYIKT